MGDQFYRIVHSGLSNLHCHLTPQGDAIQILGQRKDQGYVESVLKVSKCYTLSKYGCAEPDSFQKWIDNEIYIAVGTASSITSLSDTSTIPQNWFHFISKQQIPDFVDQSPGMTSHQH